MKKLFIGLFTAVFFMFTILPLTAQQTNYPTKKVNGVEYYIYTVQAGEGLYALSRKFGISQAEINSLNPEIQSGIKAGQQILIPVPNKENSKTLNSAGKKETQTVSVRFTEHKVEKKQTLFAISRKYDVSQEDIIKYNPKAEFGLHEGDILRIPVPTVDEEKPVIKKFLGIFPVSSKESTSKKPTDFLIHKVESGETLYSIGRRYQVEVNEIIALNPKSATTKLTVGTELKIPIKEGNKTTEQKVDTLVKTVLSPVEQELYNARINENVKPNTDPIRIAYLLPFLLESQKKDAMTKKFIDFYSGSLLAVNEAKKFGVTLDIFTFDTEKSEQKIADILQNSELQSVDFIIGPAYSNQVSLVSEFAKENKISTLIPFTSKISDVESNPYLLQFNPGNQTESDFIVNLLKTRYKDYKVVFAEIPDINLADDGNELVNNIKFELRRKEITFSEFELASPEQTDFTKILPAGEKEIVFFNTDKFGIVSSYLPALTTASESGNIVLFEQYSWLSHEIKAIPSVYISPFKKQPVSDLYAKFMTSFNEYFDWNTLNDTPRYDLLGYDLTAYIIAQLYRSGSKFTSGTDKLPFATGIQSQFKFERTSKNAGFVNQQLYSIEENKPAN